MKIFNKVIVPSLIFLILASSCTIPSLHPLYTEKDLVLDKDIEGTWVPKDKSSKVGNWKIWKYHAEENKKGNEKAGKLYRLEHTKKGETVIFDLFLVKVGDYLYLDFFPREYVTCNFENEMGAMHLFPVHTFAKVSIKKNQMSIYPFDVEFLEDLIEQNRIRISHEKTSDRILLTAPPEDLQKFVLKYADDKHAFEGPIILKQKI